MRSLVLDFFNWPMYEDVINVTPCISDSVLGHY